VTFDLTSFLEILAGKLVQQEGEVHLARARLGPRTWACGMEELFRKSVPVSVKSSDRDER
jgi:hypothetical protein